MERLNGTVNINLSVAKVNYLNELIEKDTPKALVEHKFKDGSASTRCPRCGRFLSSIDSEWKYCPDCGQAIDTECIAF